MGWGLPTQSVRQHCMGPRASATATADWCWNVFCVCSPRCDQRCDSTLTLTLPKAVFISERIFLPKTYPKVAKRLHFRIVLPRFRPNSSKVALKPWMKKCNLFLPHKSVPTIPFYTKTLEPLEHGGECSCQSLTQTYQKHLPKSILQALSVALWRACCDDFSRSLPQPSPALLPLRDVMQF